MKLQPEHPENRDPMDRAAWRQGLRDMLRGPMDPTHEHEGSEHVDALTRAVHTVAWSCAATGASIGPLVRTMPNSPVDLAALELDAYVHEHVQTTADDAYDRGYEDGYMHGKADGEAEQLHRLGLPE